MGKFRDYLKRIFKNFRKEEVVVLPEAVQEPVQVQEETNTFFDDLRENTYLEEETLKIVPIDTIEAIINGKVEIDDIMTQWDKREDFVTPVNEYRKLVENMGYKFSAEQLENICRANQEEYIESISDDTVNQDISFEDLSRIIKDPSLRVRFKRFEENREFFCGISKEEMSAKIKQFSDNLQNSRTIGKSAILENIKTIVFDRNLEHYGVRFKTDLDLDKEFKEAILADLPDDMSEIDLSKEIYKRLNSRVKYSQTYGGMPKDLDIEFMESIYNERIDEVTLENNELVCNTWSKLYCKLLKEKGIDSVISGKSKHKYVTLIADNEVITADATNVMLNPIDNTKITDLQRNTFGMPIGGFRVISDDQIDREILEEEKNLCEGHFLDVTEIFEDDLNYDQNLESEVLGNSIEDKIRALNEIFSRVDGTDSLDVLSYLNVMSRKFFTEEELSRMSRCNISVDLSTEDSYKYNVSRVITIKDEYDPNKLSHYYANSNGLLDSISTDELRENFLSGKFRKTRDEQSIPQVIDLNGNVIDKNVYTREDEVTYDVR